MTEHEAPSGRASSASWSWSRPRLLDLFCGAGGCSAGYHRAGFDVIGVDMATQPRYPFMFVRADALTFLRDWVVLGPLYESFDLIHASPPCQHYSDLAKRNGNADNHPDLIGAVRDLLERSGLPYVIENVEGAPLRDPAVLCGSHPLFDLGVDGYRLRRHRLFEMNWSPWELPGCGCAGEPRPVIDVSGGGPTHSPRRDGGGGRTYKGTVAQKRAAMGIDWMSGSELVEAIPPVYTEAIGNQFMEYLEARERRAA